MGPILYILVAFPCTVGAIALAIIHIYRHLLNYTEPTFQRYIVRIIFMVPVYALMSFLSLVFNESTIYFNSIREIYEAWVIYNFLSLCLAWVGGPGAVVLSLTGKILKPNWCLMTCCFPPIPLDGRFIRRCKQGGLQFVILKPILVTVTFILYAKAKYEDGNFSPSQSYLYLTIIYTISYSVALYALALFYVACRDLLQPFNPVPKFIIIKSVVFLTYWQGVLVFLAAKSRLIKNTEEAAEFQSFIICVEMLIAAFGHLYAFPYKEYAGANIGANHGFTASLTHALKLNDFYHDTVHQFAPTYHDYVLYNHTSEGDDGARKYRARTFVPTGPEMDTVRRNKHMFLNKSEDIQLSSPQSSGSTTPHSVAVDNPTRSEAASASLLMDASSTVALPYDLSLIDIDLSNYSAEVPASNQSAKRKPCADPPYSIEEENLIPTRVHSLRSTPAPGALELLISAVAVAVDHCVLTCSGSAPGLRTVGVSCDGAKLLHRFSSAFHHRRCENSRLVSHYQSYSCSRLYPNSCLIWIFLSLAGVSGS